MKTYLSLVLVMLSSSAFALIDGELIEKSQVPPQSCVILYGKRLAAPNFATGSLGIDDSRGLCSGVLIDDQWILTAGHCVPKVFNRNKNEKVGVICYPELGVPKISVVDRGEAYPTYNGEQIEFGAVKTKKIEGRNRNLIWNKDLGLLHLETKIDIGPMDFAIGMTSELLSNEECYIAGFAPPELSTTPRPTSLKDLHRAGVASFVSVASMSYHSARLAQQGNKLRDLITSGGTAFINHGDSGGALYCILNSSAKLAGIHSGGYKENSFQTSEIVRFGVSTNISQVTKRWIDERKAGTPVGDQYYVAAVRDTKLAIEKEMKVLEPFVTKWVKWPSTEPATVKMLEEIVMLKDQMTKSVSGLVVKENAEGFAQIDDLHNTFAGLQILAAQYDGIIRKEQAGMIFTEPGAISTKITPRQIIRTNP